MNRNNNNNAGFTLIELMIVVAIIAIIAAVAIPKLVSARISANENAAVATLRSVAAAQQQLQSSAAIDTDADGGGEHGYFGELAGTDPIRHFVVGGAPATTNNITLDPTYLPVAFGNVIDGGNGGVVERQGYYYQMFLPDASATNPIGAVAELPAGGNPGTLPGGSNCEIMWCCYAWPVQATKTGNRAFMINQAGDVIATQNQATGAVTPYNGVTTTPLFDDAFSAAGDMGSEPALSSAGLTGQNNTSRIWTPVGN